MDYYVIGLIFNDWFLTNEQCTRLMAHWMNVTDGLISLPYEHSEMAERWHGECFRELSWFWNRQKYVLPEWCPFCHEVIPALVVKTAMK